MAVADRLPPPARLTLLHRETELNSTYEVLFEISGAPMLRIAKLTDYATVLMVRLAREPARYFSAVQLADELGVPLPTVAKLLKRLLRAGLLTSVRGAVGG